MAMRGGEPIPKRTPVERFREYTRRAYPELDIDSLRVAIRLFSGKQADLSTLPASWHLLQPKILIVSAP
jgi:hypothetical protein